MFKELLQKEFSPYGPLTELQLEQLESHYDLLLKWNQRLNLTRMSRLEDAVRFHYCESLYLARSLAPGHMRIVDIGSGAGFPGIPLAILRPECDVTLVESHQRKAVFLRESSRDLPNIQVMGTRAEEVRERFDVTVSRAVAPSEVLAVGLSERFTLLIGATDAAQLGGESSRIPWGKDRVLCHVKRESRAGST